MKSDNSLTDDLSPRDRGFLLGALLLEMGPQDLPGVAAGTPVADALSRVSQGTQRAAIVDELRLQFTEALPRALGAMAAQRLAECIREEPPNVAAIAVGFLPEPTQGAVRAFLPPLPTPSTSARSGWALHREMMAAIFLPLLAEVDPDEYDGSTSPDSAWESVCVTGARLLGRSLSGASTAVLARAMAAVGSRWASLVKSAATASDSDGLRTEAQRIAARVGTVLGAQPERSAEDRLAAMGYLSMVQSMSVSQRNALRMALPTWVDELENG